MKAQFGAIVVAGSGKLGGHVASRNRAGAYFRTRVTPVNPSTADQSEARSRLASISQAWRALTAAQRAAWNAAVQDFARTDVFGNLKNPSGFNLHQRLNNNLTIVGSAVITSPPLVDDVYAPTTLSLVASEATQAITATYTAAIPAGQAVKVFATAPQSAGVNFVKSEYRLTEVIVAADASPYNLGTEWATKFGSFAGGQKIFVKFVGVNSVTGQEGSGLEVSVIAGA
jgi:hypothetical protein